MPQSSRSGSTSGAPADTPPSLAGAPDLRLGFQLGSWKVEPGLLRLEGQDGAIRQVGVKVMDALLCLASCPREVVSKDKLVAQVWQGAFTSDEALTTLIYELRKALDDEARQPRFVGTIRGRGYRLLVEPAPISEPPPSLLPEHQQVAPETPPTISRTATATTEAAGSSPAAFFGIPPLYLGAGLVLLLIALVVLRLVFPGAGEAPLGNAAVGVDPGFDTSGLATDPIGARTPSNRSAGAPKSTAVAAGDGKLGIAEVGNVKDGVPETADDAAEEGAAGQPQPRPMSDDGTNPRSSIARPVAPGGASDSAIRAGMEPASVAVLPLASPEPSSQSADQARAFADGLSERLVVELGRLGGLDIVPGFSSVAEGRSSDLGTDAVVEGSVRQVGDRLAVSVQLVERSSGRLLWGAAYDSAAQNVLDLQNQLSYEIARQIRQKLATPARSIAPEAEEAYRLGDFFLRRGTAEGHAKARDYFSLALDRDPAFARAYAGLSDAWIGAAEGLDAVPRAEAYGQARQAAEAALILDAGLPQAHTSLGTIFFEHEWDWSKAEEHFQLGCPPDSCSAEDAPRFAAFLAASGRDGKAQEVLRASLTQDPTSATARLVLAQVHYLARRFDEALVELGRAAELGAESGRQRRLEIDIYLAAGRDAEAARAIHRWTREHGSPIADSEQISTLLRQLVDAPNALHEKIGTSAVWLAGLEARLGRSDAALSWLLQAFAESDEDLVWIARDPAFDTLREHGELIALLERLGLPTE